MGARCAPTPRRRGAFSAVPARRRPRPPRRRGRPLGGPGRCRRVAGPCARPRWACVRVRSNLVSRKAIRLPIVPTVAAPPLVWRRSARRTKLSTATSHGPRSTCASSLVPHHQLYRSQVAWNAVLVLPAPNIRLHRPCLCRLFRVLIRRLALPLQKRAAQVQTRNISRRQGRRRAGKRAGRAMEK